MKKTFTSMLFALLLLTLFNGNIFAAIGWGILQWPKDATTIQGQPVTVYGQVWADGVTNLPGQGAGMQAWIGYSTENTDPSTWTKWIAATFNVDAGNNDEFMASLGAKLPAGTYYYAFRYQLNAEPYVYCGRDGFWNAATSTSGVLTVSPLTPGTYYVGVGQTAPGNTYPHFSSLKNACDAINLGPITGNYKFLITSNLVEPQNVTIGVNTNGNTITFKPLEGTVDTIKFTQTADNAGVSGAWVIGTPDLSIPSASNYGLVRTDNIVIDGSNIEGGISRDLVLITAANAHTNTTPLRPFGEVNKMVIKNIKITALQSVSYALACIVRNANSTNFVPDSITVDNCEITNTVSLTGQALAISNSGTPTAFPQAMVFKNNTITARTRGIFLNYAGSTDVFNNQISIIQTSPGYMSYGIWGLTIGSATDVTNIYNNRIIKLLTANNAAADYGIVGIECGSKGTYNVYNNMISGFETTTTAANPNVKLIGIRLNAAAVTANVYHNSINLPEINFNQGTGVVTYAGIYVGNGTNTVKNNIIVAGESTTPSYAIYRAGTSGTLVSDYNDLYPATAAASVGYFNTTAAPSLSAWSTASSQDANSLSADPKFKSDIDLHLLSKDSSFAVIGKGTKLPGFMTDIDGEERDTIPELGADEFPGYVPVELSSFTASFSGNDVMLHWSTATETNNDRFEIERSFDKAKWNVIGKVNGRGTTTTPSAYSFSDRNVTGSAVYYRLRQVDFDGTSKYTSVVEVKGITPSNYALSQNYPNPFNPTTKINYSIPVDGKVVLSVYTITGELVAELVNSDMQAGQYTVDFNASSLASGTYFYKITAGNFVQVKKMMLVK